MNNKDIKVEIQSLATQAAQLSKEAQTAFAERNFAIGKALMKQAVYAGRNCQNLIEEYTQQMNKKEQPLP